MKEDLEKLKEAALPLIKYLAENHHPHTQVTVTSTGAEMFEGIASTGEMLDYIKD
jgi:hypothetical protein